MPTTTKPKLGKPVTLKPSAPATEHSEVFLQGMLDRMGVSFYKYGAVADAEGRVNFIESLKMRLDKYIETGNTEWLMDVANFAMIEFMVPAHPDAHFLSTDSSESPGRLTRSGNVTKTDKNTRLIKKTVSV